MFSAHPRLYKAFHLSSSNRCDYNNDDDNNVIRTSNFLQVHSRYEVTVAAQLT